MTIAAPPAPTTPAATNGAAAPVGTPADAAPLVSADDGQVKKAYALLAKKERGLALKAHDLAQKQQAHKEREAEYQAWQTERASTKRDPVRFLEKEFGKDWYDKLTEVKLNGGKVTPELVLETIDERLGSFEKKHEAERLKAAEAEQSKVQAEEQRMLETWRADVAGFVKQNAEAYELINHFEVHDRVTAKIESEFAKTQKLLSPKEAADLIEKDLEERGAKSKKFGKAPAAPASADKRFDPQQRRTLSNDMAATTPAAKPLPADDRERMKRALEAMHAVELSRSKG